MKSTTELYRPPLLRSAYLQLNGFILRASSNLRLNVSLLFQWNVINMSRVDDGCRKEIGMNFHVLPLMSRGRQREVIHHALRGCICILLFLKRGHFGGM